MVLGVGGLSGGGVFGLGGGALFEAS
jgi:hypothetical protein